MSTRRSKENAKQFYAMLARKRERLTGSEFIQWFNQHHARTDPYSFTQYRQQNRPAWKQTAAVKHTVTPGIFYKDKYLPKHYAKPKPITRSLNSFDTSCRHTSASHTRWVRSLRCYP